MLQRVENLCVRYLNPQSWASEKAKWAAGKILDQVKAAKRYGDPSVINARSQDILSFCTTLLDDPGANLDMRSLAMETKAILEAR